MKLSTLVEDVCRKNKTNFIPRNIRSITASCRVADIPEDITTSNRNKAIRIINIAISSHKNRIEVRSSAKEPTPAQDTDKCPICQAKMQVIKLINERKANYCPIHKVTLPIMG